VEIIAQWKLFDRQFTQEHGHKPSLEQVAAELKLGNSGVATLERAMTSVENFSRPVSLDLLWSATGEVADSRAATQAESPTSDLIDGRSVDALLRSINEREAEVLRLRYGLYSGQAMTLDEIGKKLKLTRERIRQIQKTALRKLQEKLAASASD
jgi:RNA polymerase primary sigma factor